MDGIAGSSFDSECCGTSVCTKQAIPVINTLNFAGIGPKRESQHVDSTSVKMIALNPNSLGAARSLGIRMHSTRCAIARKGLDLRCSITQGVLADFLSKKMPRKTLARLGAAFFNCLAPNWREDWDDLQLIVPIEHHPELVPGSMVGHQERNTTEGGISSSSVRAPHRRV